MQPKPTHSDCFALSSFCPGLLYSWVLASTEPVKVTQSCLILCDSFDYTVHGILQARILKWVAFPFSRVSSQPRDLSRSPVIAGGFFTSWAKREAGIGIAGSKMVCPPPSLINSSCPGLSDFTALCTHSLGETYLSSIENTHVKSHILEGCFIYLTSPGIMTNNSEENRSGDGPWAQAGPGPSRVHITGTSPLACIFSSAQLPSV